jgi:(p)ppGpp synthase/HD superfamily hydrolase
MILTHRLQYAINEASRLHRDQFRKDSLKTPYITHLVGVMILLSSATHDEDVLIAGLLHDALEDVPGYTSEKLKETFGERVLEIVLGVTEEFKLRGDEAPSWKIEKLHYIENLKKAPDESVLVSLADKIQNTRSYIELMNVEGLGILANFGAGNDERLWFHNEVLMIGEERLGEDHILVEELRAEIEELKRVIQTVTNK